MTLEERVDALEQEVLALQANLINALELVRSLVAELPEDPVSISEQIRVGRAAANLQREVLAARKETA